MNKSVIPVIAIVGQENVGKSTLFNRLTRTDSALVSNNSQIGLTRDRRYGYIVYRKYKSVIIDTGSFNRLSITKIQSAINYQTMLAIKDSHVVLFVVNGCLSVSSVDYDIADYLRKLGKNIFLVINKVDDYILYNRLFSYDYYSLGIKETVFISAVHGHGINDLLKQIFFKISRQFYNCKNYILNIDKNHWYFNQLGKIPLYHDNDINQFIKLAVIGRPNVGKSTFINYILKTNRMITSEIPGTTRDSIYIPTTYDNQKYILIDTAGIRKKKQIQDIIEHEAVVKTLQVLKKSHITLFLIDMTEGVVDQDWSLLRLILRQSQSLIIVVNKCDKRDCLVTRNNIIDVLIEKSKFLNNAKTHFISSVYGYGIKELFQSIKETYKSSMQTISTAQLVRIMNQAIIKYPPPFLMGKKTIPKLKYVHIGGYNPIIIIIHGNQVSQLSVEYQKYLKNFFYRSLNIRGMTIRFYFKDTINPFI